MKLLKSLVVLIALGSSFGQAEEPTDLYLHEQTLKCMSALRDGYSYSVKTPASMQATVLPDAKSKTPPFSLTASIDHSKSYLLTSKKFYVFKNDVAATGDKYLLFDLGADLENDPAFHQMELDALTPGDGHVVWKMEGLQLGFQMTSFKYVEPPIEGQAFPKPIHLTTEQSEAEILDLLQSSSDGMLKGIQAYDHDLAGHLATSSAAEKKWYDKLTKEMKRDQEIPGNEYLKSLLALSEKEVRARFHNYFSTGQDADLQKLSDSELCHPAISRMNYVQPEYCKTYNYDLTNWDETSTIIAQDRKALASCQDAFQVLPKEKKIFDQALENLNALKPMVTPGITQPAPPADVIVH